MGTKNSPGANPEQPADEAELRRRIDAGSQDPEDYRALAHLLDPSGRYEEAKELIERALRLPLTDLQRGKLSIEYGWLFHDVFGRDDEALNWARAGLGLLPQETQSPETLVLRGSGQSLVARCIQASDSDNGSEAARLGLQHVEEALAKNPDSNVTQSAYREAIDLHLFLDQADEAVRCCKSYLRFDLADQERVNCLLQLGTALRYAGELSEAGTVLRDLLAELKANNTLLPRIHCELGLVELARNCFNEARDHLRSSAGALRAHPTLGGDNVPVFETIEINVNLARACYELGHYHEAVWACEQGDRTGPDC